MTFDSHIRDIIARRLDRMWAVGRRYGLALAALALASLTESASAQVLPPDAKATCALDSTELSRWFEGGRVQKDGVVTPADSLNSPPGSDCDFYKWGERMFLWLTSPDRTGGKVFQSSVFFGVSPPGPPPERKRTLLQTARDKITISFSLRTPKPVEHGGLPGRQRGVLMSQNKSLVYSATMVNEVYAYLLTGKRHNRITLDRFPVLDDDMAKIIQFASDQGFTITQPNILAVQVKTAWVETARFREFNLDPSKYLTIRAEIPTYTADAANRQLTPTPNQTREAELALVGMHVVGSIREGSGLVWATFEHVDNVPIQPYYYAPADGGEPREFRPQPAPDKTWLFSKTNCVEPNRMRMHARNPPHIDFDPDFGPNETTIGPSDTCRLNAWGSPVGADGHAANTHIISLNDSIGRMLDGGDVRKNYMLIGAIWNFNDGATKLANSTLETYEQQGGCTEKCHVGELDQGNLSHMFIPLQPLPLRR
jgi:hypothetical protein